MGNGPAKPEPTKEEGINALWPEIPESSRPKPVSPEELKANHGKRSQIVSEIVETERNYVNALVELGTNWEKPLLKALATQPVLSKEEITTIFSISDGICCLHSIMLQAFQDKLATWTEKQTLGDVFVKNANALGLYTQYINGYNDSIETISKVSQYPSFMNFVSNNRLGTPTTVLPALLIQPIQRIPRYVLLLQDLVQNTYPFHPDYPALSGALEQIRGKATAINEQKRLYEKKQNFAEMQSLLGKAFIRLIGEPGRTVEKMATMNVNGADVSYAFLVDSFLFWRPGKKAKVFVFGMYRSCIVRQVAPDNLAIEFSTEMDKKTVTFPNAFACNTWFREYNSLKRAWDLDPASRPFPEGKLKKGGLNRSIVGNKRIILPTIVEATPEVNMNDLVALYVQFLDSYKKEGTDPAAVSTFFTERWRDHHMKAYMAYLEGQPIGFAILYLQFYSLSLVTAWEICAGFVQKVYRGTAISTKIVQEISKDLGIDVAEMKEFNRDEQCCKEQR